MATATVRFVYGLTSTEPGASILRTDWNTIGNGPYTCKIKRYDLEAPTIEVKNISPGVVYPERWEHCVMIRDTVYPYNGSNGLLVYVIKAMRQGPVGKILNASTGTPVTNDNGTIEFDLELDCLATYHANNRGLSTPSDWQLKAIWSRYPVPDGPMEPLQIRPAQMKRSKTQNLPVNVPQDMGSYGWVFYVEVNYVDNGVFRKRVTFATGTRMQVPDAGINGGTPSNTYYYPAISEVMNSPEMVLGLTASTIISMCISPRCPFKVIKSTHGGWLTAVSGGNELKLEVLGQDPNQTTTKFIGYTGNGYDDGSMTGSLVLTDKERLMGQVRIYDVNASIIGSIDTRYAEWDSVNSRWSIDFTMYTWDNMNNLNTTITLADGTEITFPEGTIPYNGSRYQEYAVAELAYDRELLAMNQEKVVADAALGMSGSLINGAFIAIASGGAGAGAAATGIAGAGINAWLSYEQNKRGQEAKEQLMKDTPDTLYSNGYGTGYYKKYTKTLIPGFIAVNMPDGVSDGDLTYYVNRHGYPVTDWENTLAYSSMPSEGFMQGELIDPNGSNVLVRLGEYKRIFARQLKQGIHFKMIS